jgi:hypothetical protein
MQDDARAAAAARTGLEHREEQARAIAGQALAGWLHVDAALSPVIGHGGVAALYRRSLFLTRAQYPWLPSLHAGGLDPVEFTDLQAALAQQTVADASAADQALQRTFHDLLASLIGDSLTERLLRPASGLPSNGDPAQDTSS